MWCSMSAQLINLFESIKTGDINSVRKIIFANPELIDSVREDDYYEDTPLTFAANHDDKNIVDILLKRGANINKVNSYGFNAYFSAVNEQNLDLAFHILQNEKLDLAHETFSKSDALGHLLRKIQHFYNEETLPEKINIHSLFKLIDSLFDKGFDINKPQLDSKDTPILICAGSQSWALVAYLISKGADYTAKNNYKYDIWTHFCGNKYLTPKAKYDVLSVLDATAKQSGEKYGKLKKPENLYVDIFGNLFDPSI